MNPQVIESIEWLRSDSINSFLYYTISVLSLGILPLFGIFYPTFTARLKCIVCDPIDSDFAIVGLSNPKSPAINFLFATTDHFTNDNEHVISFGVDGYRFVASSLDNWEVSIVDEVPLNFKRFLSPHPPEGLQARERQLLEMLYGKNRMDIPIPNLVELFARHAVHPLLLFGYFAAVLWFYQDYLFWGILLTIAVVSALYVMTQTSYLNIQRLRTMAGGSKPVQVVNSDSYINGGNNLGLSTVDDSELIVGDRFLVPENFVMPCDGVLVSGRIVADEAMLTGESIPVTKTPIQVSALENSSVKPILFASKGVAECVVGAETGAESAEQGVRLGGLPAIQVGHASLTQPEKVLSPAQELSEKFSHNIVFAGTRIKYASEDSICVAYKTGFRSMKGNLIHTLLHPREDFLNFFEDLELFIILILILATLLFVYEAMALQTAGYSTTDIVLNYLDAITDAIPIGLAVCLIISTYIAYYQLREGEIFVSESSRINISGIVTICCFDKTGTLTEENLQFHSALVSQSCISDGADSFMTESQPMVGDMLEFIQPSENSFSAKQALPKICAEVMATCHGLSVLSSASAPVGDLLEVELLRASGWSLSTSPFGPHIVALSPSPSPSSGTGTPSSSPESRRHEILCHFEFNPVSARSSTLLLRPNGEMVYLVKGSPESICAIVNHSTLPPNFHKTMEKFGQRGLRILAFGYRICRESRDSLIGLSESEFSKMDITFGGCLALISKLKADSRSTIQQLHQANIGINMITGDYVYTALAVAADCGIISPQSVVSGMGSAVLQVEPSTALSPTSSSVNFPTYHFIVDADVKTGRPSIQDCFFEAQLQISILNLLQYASACQDYLNCKSAIGMSAVDDESSLPLLEEGRTSEDRADHNFAKISSTAKMLWNSRKVGVVVIAVTGKGLKAARRFCLPYVVDSLLRYTKVFARTQPQEKGFIVEALMKPPCFDCSDLLGSISVNSTSKIMDGDRAEAVDETAVVLESDIPVNVGENDIVLFCGDGANDVTALRMASVGLSLCDVETSIAAPVTARVPTPSAVISLLLEGRWSIVTAYGLANLNIYNSIILTFFYVFVFGMGLKMSDSMFLVAGIFLIISSVAVLLPSKAAGGLSKELPPKRYFSFQLLVFVVPQFFLFPIFQVLVYWILTQQSFYVAFVTDDPFTTAYSYECTVLQDTALMQFIIAAALSAVGHPFQQPWYESVGFVVAEVVMLIWVIYQLFAGSSDFAEDMLDLMPLPTYFGFVLLGLFAAHVFVSTAVWYVSFHFFSPRLRRTLPVVLKL